MATRSLSPKQIAERERQHRFAVISLARYKAKRRVQEQLRAQGRRVSLIRPAEIAALAQAEFELNRISLIAAAEKAIATSPLFKRWRYLVQMSKQMHKRRSSQNQPLLL